MNSSLKTALLTAMFPFLAPAFATTPVAKSNKKTEQDFERIKRANEKRERRRLRNLELSK